MEVEALSEKAAHLREDAIRLHSALQQMDGSSSVKEAAVLLGQIADLLTILRRDERKLVEFVEGEVLRVRARQQAVVADLGQRALRGADLDQFLQEAVVLVADTLDVEYCKVLELLPAGDALLLRAGVGWKEGLVGQATVGAEQESQAGYTLLSSEPVVVEELRREKRFSGPPLLHQHNVVSGISVIIHGREKPYGVMGAHTTHYRHFTKDDVNFLQAVANVVATAIERQKDEEAIRRSRDQLDVILRGVAEGITVLDRSGRFVFVNEVAVSTLGFKSVESVLALSSDELAARFDILDEEGQPFPVERLPGRLALQGQWPAETLLRFRNRETGQEHWWILNATPIFDEHGEVQLAVNIFHDVTERYRLYEAEREARAEAEVANRHLEFLARASAILAHSLDYTDTLQQIAHLTVPWLADWCVIDLLKEDGSLERVAVYHRDSDKVRAAYDLVEYFLIDGKFPAGIGHVLDTAEAELLVDVTDEMLRDIAQNDEHYQLLQSLQLRSALVAPLQARERMLGTLTLATDESGRHFGPADLALALELASRAALAVDNARLYAESNQMSKALEQRVHERTRELEQANRQLEAEIAERLQAEAQMRLQASRTSALVRAATRLNMQLDLDRVLVAVCEETVRALDVPIATVSLYDHRRELFQVRAGIGLPIDFLSHAEPLPRAVYETYHQEQGNLVVVPDVQMLADLPNASVYAAHNVRTTVSVSMSRDGQLVGRLNIGTIIEPRTFDEEELALLQGLAEQAALAIANAQEVAERRQIEEALRRSEEYFRSLTENASDIITILDEAWTIRYESPSVRRLLGYQPQELTGRKLYDLIHPDDVPEVMAVLEEATPIPNATRTVEFRFRHKDGSWRILESMGRNLLHNPAVHGLVINSRDITRRKEAEETVHALLRISATLNATLDVDELLQLLTTEAIALVNAEAGFSGLRTAEGMVTGRYMHHLGERPFSFTFPPGYGVPGWLIEHKVPYLSNDISGDPQVIPEICAELGIKSALSVPMLDNSGDVIGFFEVNNKRGGAHFTHADQEKMISLSQIAAVAIQNALAYRKLSEAEDAVRRETALVQLLQQVATAANEAENVDDVFSFVLAQLSEHTGWPVGHVYLVGPDQQLLPSAIWYLRDPERFEQFRQLTMETPLSSGVGLPGQVLATGKPIWSTELARDSKFVRGQRGADIQLSTGFAFPVLAGSDVVAVVEFFSETLVEQDEELLALTANIGTQLGRVIERTRAETTLKQRESQLAEAQRIAQLGSWEWQLTANSLFWSDELYRIYGYEPGDFEVDYQRYLRGVHPDDRADVEATIQDAVETGEEFNFYHRIVRPDGIVRICHSRGRCIVDRAGRVVAMVGTAQDVTELRETQTQLEKQTQQLAALSRMGQAVASSLDLAEVLQRVLDQVSPLIPAEGISVLLLEGSELRFAATSGPGAAGLINQRRPLTMSIAKEAIEADQSLWVKDPSGRQHLFRMMEEAEGYRVQAILIAPLKLWGEIIGVVEAIHSQADAFNEEDLRLLEASATWSSIAIGNARQHERLQMRLQETQTLAAISRALSETLDVSQMLLQIARAARQIIPRVEWSVIHLYDRETGLLQPVASFGLPELDRETYALQPGEGFAGRSYSDGTVINVPDVRKDPRRLQLHDQLQIRSLLVAPVKELGTISVRGKEATTFSPDDERLLSALGVQAALAIQNARLYQSLEEEKSRLELLYMLSRDLATTLNPHEVAVRALELIMGALGAMRGELYMMEPGGEHLRLTAFHGRREMSIGSEVRQDLRLGEGATGYVAQMKSALILADVLRDERWVVWPGVDDDVRSAAIIPLLVGDTRVGVLSLLSERVGYFRDEHLPLLRAAATPVALALQNAQLFAAEQRARQVADTLRASNLTLSGTLDLDKVLENLLVNLNDLIPYDSANVMLQIDETKLAVRALRGYEEWQDPDQVHRLIFDLNENRLLQSIFETGQSELVNETKDEPRWQKLPDTDHIRSWIGVPLVSRGAVIGVFSVDKAEPDFFTDAHLQITEAMAAQAAIALQNARLFEEVRASRERLRQLTKQVVSAQEEERQRVSRELHDEAGQALTALKITLDLIRGKLPDDLSRVRQEISDAVMLTDQTMEQIRRLAQNLRPPALETLGLGATLEGLCREFSKRTQLDIEFDGGDVPRLPDAIVISLYRFVQEALTNVAKHSNASEVGVTLRHEDGLIHVCVTDDGVGFDVNEVLSSLSHITGLGLLGMHERLELLGGRLEIESRPGAGTRLNASIPVTVES